MEEKGELKHLITHYDLKLIYNLRSMQAFTELLLQLCIRTGSQERSWLSDLTLMGVYRMCKFVVVQICTTLTMRRSSLIPSPPDFISQVFSTTVR